MMILCGAGRWWDCSMIASILAYYSRPEEDPHITVHEDSHSVKNGFVKA